MGASNTKLVVSTDEKRQWNMLLALVQNPTVENCKAFLKRHFGSKDQAEHHLANVESLCKKIGYDHLERVLQQVVSRVMNSEFALEGGHVLERYGVTKSELSSLLVLVCVTLVAFVAISGLIHSDMAVQSVQLLTTLGNTLGLVGTTMLIGNTMAVITYADYFQLGRYVPKKLLYKMFDSVYTHFPVAFKVIKTIFTILTTRQSTGYKLVDSAIASAPVLAALRPAAAAAMQRAKSPSRRFKMPAQVPDLKRYEQQEQSVEKLTLRAEKRRLLALRASLQRQQMDITKIDEDLVKVLFKQLEYIDKDIETSKAEKLEQLQMSREKIVQQIEQLEL